MADSSQNDQRVIVIAVDESDHSDYAFQYFMTNFYKKNDMIILVHCPEYHAMVHSSAVPKDATALRASMEREEQRVRELLEKFGAKLKEKGIGGRVKSVAGKPGEGVVQVADEQNATLIVTGNRGMSNFRRTLMGSVSDYIMHHATCPVLICLDKSVQQRRKSVSVEPGQRRKSIFNVLIR